MGVVVVTAPVCLWAGVTKPGFQRVGRRHLGFCQRVSGGHRIWTAEEQRREERDFLVLTLPEGHRSSLSLVERGGGVLSQSLPSVCMLMMNMLSFTSPYWFQLLHMAPFKEQHNNYATASFEKCFFLLLHQNVNMRDDQLITFAKEEFRSRKSDRAENPKHTEGFASTSLFNVCSLEVVSAVLDVCRSNKAPRLPSLCSALLLLYLTHGPFELFN